MMSPGSKRNLKRYLITMASALVGIPMIFNFGQSSVMTWLGTAALLIGAVLLFRNRSRTRTLFLLPICYIPFLIAARIGAVNGKESSAFTAAILVGLVVVFSAMVIDGFWSPYKDDLEDLEYQLTRRD